MDGAAVMGRAQTTTPGTGPGVGVAGTGKPVSVHAVIYFLAAEAAGLAAEAAAAGFSAFFSSFLAGASAAKAVTAKAAVITAAKSLFISGTFLKFE